MDKINTDALFIEGIVYLSCQGWEHSLEWGRCELTDKMWEDILYKPTRTIWVSGLNDG
jgi:hypothetical protein